MSSDIDVLLRNLRTETFVVSVNLFGSQYKANRSGCKVFFGTDLAKIQNESKKSLFEKKKHLYSYFKKKL